MPGELLNYLRIEFIAMDKSFKYLNGLALWRASSKLLTFIRVCSMVVDYCMIRKVRCCFPNTEVVAA